MTGKFISIHLWQQRRSLKKIFLNVKIKLENKNLSNSKLESKGLDTDSISGSHILPLDVNNELRDFQILEQINILK